MSLSDDGERGPRKRHDLKYGQSDDESSEEDSGDSDVEDQGGQLDVRAFEREHGLDDEENGEDREESAEDRLEQDVEDEEQDGKKSPLLEPFHLEDDAEDGVFDQAGNYVRNQADENAHQDAWLLDVSKRDIASARKAHDKKSNGSDSRESIENLLGRTVDLLGPDETPLEALQRLGRLEKSARKAQVDALTEAVDPLLAAYSRIYEMTREELLREYTKRTGEPYSKKRKRKDVDEYEFRWDGAPEVHGPYSLDDMRAWAADGYFDDRLWFRLVGSDFQQYSSGVFD